MTVIEKLDLNHSKHVELNRELIEIWQSEVLFTWRWWIGVLLTVITWLFWIKIRKRFSTQRLLTAGYFVMVISLTLDVLGVQIGLWSYRYEVIPYIPAFVPWDLALMPIVIMTLIQFFPAIRPMVKALLFGLLTSFVGEPVVVWLDMYKPISWKPLYSLPIYMLIYFVAHRMAIARSFEPIYESRD